jgi:hypothetical protein
VRNPKLLGTASGGGKKRAVKHLMGRVKVARDRIGKYHKARAIVVDVRSMVRAQAIPAMTYGVDIIGFSDSHLRVVRGVAARAVAPETGGESVSHVLSALDAGGGRVVPAFDARVLPIRQWASAVWEGWAPATLLCSAMRHAAHQVRGAQRSVWDRATGPAAAVTATIWRLGSRIISPTVFATGTGEILDSWLPCTLQGR